jgi:Concanavalin A-like lectin/glucanases superfamily
VPVALLALAFVLLPSCENDVSVRLLPKVTSNLVPDANGGSAGAGIAEPAAGAAGEAPVCISGDRCSGLVRALRFRGAYDRVEIASSPQLDVPQDFTIEAWVLVKSYSAGHGIFNRWARGLGDIELTFGTPVPLPQLELPTLERVPSHVLASWAFVRPDYWLTAVASSPPTVDAWHHLASAYGGGSFKLYVDGVLASSIDATDPVANPQNTLYLGATARSEELFDPAQGTLYWPPVDGFIADVRVSSNNRYRAEFTPEQRLSPDASTIALWHLDEGEGTTAVDSGPSQLAGSIFGATWELAPLRAVLPRD